MDKQTKAFTAIQIFPLISEILNMDFRHGRGCSGEGQLQPFSCSHHQVECRSSLPRLVSLETNTEFVAF